MLGAVIVRPRSARREALRPLAEGNVCIMTYVRRSAGRSLPVVGAWQLPGPERGEESPGSTGRGGG